MKNKQMLRFSILVLFIVFSNLNVVLKNEFDVNIGDNSNLITQISPKNGPVNW